MEAATPPANVYEGNGQLSVAAPIPGAHPEHVEVIVTPTRVQVAASCKYAQENQHYHQHEWLVGAWDLSVDLPQRAGRHRADVGDRLRGGAAVHQGDLRTGASPSTGRGAPRPYRGVT